VRIDRMGPDNYWFGARPQILLDRRGDFRKLAMRRAGEGSQRHFRSDRVYQAEGGWYCLTREAGALGPFSTQEDASEQLDAYISTMGARKPQAPAGIAGA